MTPFAPRRTAAAWLTLTALAALTPPTARGGGATDSDDDALFRATVVVRRGGSLGSGTVIASAPGETLVLTAAHVVEPSGPGADAGVEVEVHRFNLGRERTVPAEGWPVRLAAGVAAADAAADVAVVRVRGREALPFVARLAAPGSEPKAGAAVVSLGVDLGERLSSWPARVRETAWFLDEDAVAAARGGRPGSGRDFDSGIARASASVPGAGEPEPFRPYLITTRGPRPGRSGGGLFDASGRLVGVCVGRITGGPDRGRGVFASVESVRRLLRAAELEPAVARPAGRIVKPGAGAHNTPN